MPLVCRRLAVLLSVAALLCGGCGGGGSTVSADESNDPLYQQAQDYKKQGRYNEALNAFLKEIDRRGESGAPESHLEAGALYLNWSHNPIEAYHHFSKYLELEPTGPRASIVRGQRDAAAREILRYLHAPSDAQMLDVTQNQEADQLRREVAELRAENQTLRGASGVPVVRQPVAAAPMLQNSNPAASDDTPVTPVQTPPPESTFTRGLNPSARTAADVPEINAPPANVPVANAPRVIGSQSPGTARPTTPQRPGAIPGARRTHTVAPGEKSLWGIARHYYSSVNQARVTAIYDANRDVMRSPNDLRVGMVLRIP